MWFFDDIPDWWDKQKHRTKEILTEFVARTHFWWRIAIAGTVKEGGRRGLAQDGLLALAGPLAKGTRGAARFFTRDPGGGICGWVSATQVLRQTGVKHFATLEDQARAAGRTPGPSSMHEMTNLLRRLGADVRPSARFPSMKEIAAFARAHPNGVVMFQGRLAGETWRSTASQYFSPDLASILAGTLQALSYEQGLTDSQAPVPKPGATLLIPR